MRCIQRFCNIASESTRTVVVKKTLSEHLMKFPPASLLEIEYGPEERRLVIVRLDGVSYQDREFSASSQPKIIHESLNPRSLGHFFKWVREQELQDVMKQAIQYLRENGHDKIIDDPLLLPKVIWTASRLQKTSDPGECMKDAVQSVLMDDEKLAEYDRMADRYWEMYRRDNERTVEHEGAEKPEVSYPMDDHVNEVTM